MPVKISQRTVDDLLVLIHHSKRDLSYGDGGSYCTDGGGSDNEFDKWDAKKAERAIGFILKLIERSINV